MLLRSHISPILIMAPLMAFTVVFSWDRGPFADLPVAPDHEQASFARCAGPVRVSCVVDGDTFWYRGTKIRIADINTPEVSRPRCAAEARLGAQASRRLAELLNTGPFTLQPIDRATDAYGRQLFIVTRNGASLGAQLVDEELAESWRGYRGEWC
jgi:micrococcal nuclease